MFDLAHTWATVSAHKAASGAEDFDHEQDRANSYPVAKLPSDLRQGLDPADHVTVTVEAEAKSNRLSVAEEILAARNAALPDSRRDRHSDPRGPARCGGLTGLPGRSIWMPTSFIYLIDGNPTVSGAVEPLFEFPKRSRVLA